MKIYKKPYIIDGVNPSSIFPAVASLSTGAAAAIGATIGLTRKADLVRSYEHLPLPTI